MMPLRRAIIRALCSLEQKTDIRKSQPVAGRKREIFPADWRTFEPAGQGAG
jgi:hypothetical protein